MKLFTGDCLAVMPTLEANSVDTIITDPPYGLSNGPTKYLGDTGGGGGFMGKDWDHGVPGVAFWAEALRVAKPGAFLLAFGGTRTVHRLACAIEDAGWEIRDRIMWVYGSGFPKSHDISKAIDKAAGAEREVLPGKRHEKYNTVNGTTFGGNDPRADHWNHITAPATPAAETWHGWGTAMKPAYEPLIWATKPLTVVPLDDIIQEINILIEGVLCLLLSSVNDVEKILALSQSGPEQQSIVAMSAALLNGHTFGGLSEKMDTFNSPETVSTCLSIASLWNGILGEALTAESMFTTSTETEATIGLKTLRYLLSGIIPDYITQGVLKANGMKSFATSAVANSTAASLNTESTLRLFAAELASWKTEESGTPANNAANSLQPIIPSVVSVLKSVTTNLDARIDISPAYEPIIVAMKLLDGTFAQNALAHGVAGLWIDGGRVPTGDILVAGGNLVTNSGNDRTGAALGMFRNGTPNTYKQNTFGRWPANLIHSGEDEVLALFPESKSATNKGATPGHHFTAGNAGDTNRTVYENGAPYAGDTGSAARFFMTCPPDEPRRLFYTAKASKSERDAGLDGIEETPFVQFQTANGTSGKPSSISEGRTTAYRNTHPTVKPLSLMRYLCRLTKTPTGGVILDPFMGSGTTGCAAVLEGRDFIGIEQDAHYVDISRLRIAHWQAVADEEAAKPQQPSLLEN